MSFDVNARLAAVQHRMLALGIQERFTIKVVVPEQSSGGWVIDLDGEHVVSTFIVWPTGATEATVLDVASENRVYFDETVVDDGDALEQAFAAFLAIVIRVEGPTR